MNPKKINYEILKEIAATANVIKTQPIKDSPDLTKFDRTEILKDQSKKLIKDY